ncbi:MAG: hypothetical protein WCC32_03695 [Terriglobales bacterium]
MKVLVVLLDRIVHAEPTAFSFGICRRLRNDAPFPIPQPSFLFLQLVQGNIGVIADLHERLLTAVHTEADVVDTFFVVFRFAIDHCVLRLEATLGLVNGLAERAFAVLGDADVQRCGAACHEKSPDSQYCESRDFTIFSNRNRSKIVTSSRNPHVWL